MAITSAPSPSPWSHTDPNTAMFVGQGAGQRGGRDGRRGGQKGGGKRARQRGLEILESPRQRVQHTKGTKDGFKRRNFSSDIL